MLGQTYTLETSLSKLGADKILDHQVKAKCKPGVMHICPQGHRRSIINTGEDDLVMLTIVIKR